MFLYGALIESAPDLNDSLCLRCRLIDFAAIVERSGDELNGTIIANIGLLPAELSDSDCQLCAFLFKLTDYTPKSPGGLQNSPWRLCAFDSFTATEILTLEIYCQSLVRSFLVYFLIGSIG
jgi:hypothetical protein